ncbi:MAG: PD-(D/E)XK nuclease family protein, partial [Oscillospiraceae bacterium]|nr:PD-(D/E)XK nuclease family protein [Oscillospiraceae bacterium]
MLNIVWGRAHAPHARYLMDEAAALARGGQKRQILLAPEPFSHETERLLCELGGDAISLSCEVLTFTRLIHRVLAAEGGLADARLDPAGRLLLLSRALEAVRPSLTRWGRKAGSPLFLERLMATIDELKAYEAKPEALSVPPGEAASGPSAGKLNDLRLIWEAFDALAARVSVSDPRDLPSRVAELIDTCPYAGGTRLYIDGFISFTAQERRIVSAFIRRADAVTFCAPAPPPGFEDGAAHWEQPRGTAAALEREARRYGVKVTHHTLPCDDTAYHPALRRVETLVMGGGPDIPDIEKTPPSRDALILHEAADVFAECEWAAELARSWVDGPQGVRCRDIVISAPDWELYGAALESACLRRGLPLFTDSAAPLTHKAAARFMTSALEAAADGMSADSVIALIKTGLTPLTADQSFMLEDYIRVHGVQGAHWSRAEPWTAHPSGWGETGFSERDRERLGAVNSARERLRGPLTALRAAFGRVRSGLGYTRALYDFCESMELPQSLAANCERLEARGLEQQAAEGRRLWDVLCRAMDTCAELIENWECAPDTFNHLFGLCLTQYGVGVIPIALDRMQAGPYDRLRRRAPRRLIMLGASEPFMPRANEAPGLLTDEERVLIELNGVSLAPRAEERASRELFNLYRCFSMPSETLAVCRPVAIDGAPSRPSLFFERLAALWDGADNEPEVGLAADAGSKADAGPWVSGRAPLGERSAGILFSGGGALSPIRMQTYQTCRFQYFARYALRARPRPEPGPRPSAAGSLIHDALRVMVEGVMERGGFRAVTRAEALEMAGRAAGEYARALPGRELRTARELRLLAGLRAP